MYYTFVGRWFKITGFSSTKVVIRSKHSDDVFFGAEQEKNLLEIISQFKIMPSFQQIQRQKSENVYNVIQTSRKSP